MKKIIFFNIIAASFWLSENVIAQVGVNTSTPTATLDITAKNATGTTTGVDGLLVPRVDRQRAQSMAGTPTSTLVYINSIATGTQTGTAVNIDATGYYYYNGTVWVKLNAGSGTDTSLYNTNGTLSGNRTVTQGTNTLAFNSSPTTGTSHFNVDGPTFNIDALNNRIGIGTNTPGTKLNVVDNSDDNQYNGIASFMANNLTIGVGIGYNGLQMVGSNADIDLTLNSKGTGSILMQTQEQGNVGVSTETPQRKLHVNGDMQLTNEFNVGGDASTAGDAGTDGQVLTSAGAGAAPEWKNLSTVSGTIATVHYVQGTTGLNINQGTTADVPGVSISVTVPEGRTQTFLFTILGYAIRTNQIAGAGTQGVFTLLQDGTKISSAYTAAGEFGTPPNSALSNVPASTTFLKAVTLGEGTYVFKVQYSAWFGPQRVNHNPSNFTGYDGDNEAMLTKMQVLVYNN